MYMLYSFVWGVATKQMQTTRSTATNRKLQIWGRRCARRTAHRDPLRARRRPGRACASKNSFLLSIHFLIYKTSDSDHIHSIVWSFLKTRRSKTKNCCINKFHNSYFVIFCDFFIFVYFICFICFISFVFDVYLYSFVWGVATKQMQTTGSTATNRKLQNLGAAVCAPHGA